MTPNGSAVPTRHVVQRPAEVTGELSRCDNSDNFTLLARDLIGYSGSRHLPGCPRGTARGSTLDDVQHLLGQRLVDPLTAAGTSP
jgi:hypothetical protein